MGAQESILRHVEMGERLDESSHLYKTWTDICPSRYKTSINSTTFVRIFCDTDTEETRNFFDNGIATLRQLRHPNIVSYIGSSIISTEACVVCERCKPLEIVLDSLDPLEILCGLNSILDAISFLNDDAQLYHNNISPDACFVCPDGEFKLGSFECAQRADNSRHWVLSDFAKTIKQTAFLPPEDQNMIKSDAPEYARDSYGFGKLIEYLYPYMEDILDEKHKDDFVQIIKQLTNEDAKLRPEVGSFKNRKVFQNPITDISTFIANLPSKSKDEKTQFFSGLPTLLKSLPNEVTAKRLIKPMLSRYSMLQNDVIKYLLADLLTPKVDDNPERGIYPPPIFRRFVVPEICRIFRVHEKSIRLGILVYFNCYVQYFNKAIVKEHILPELLLGMKDLDNEIVSQSLRCLGLVVPILDGQTVTGLTHYKYFADGKPRDSEELETGRDSTKIIIKSIISPVEPSKPTPMDVPDSSTLPSKSTSASNQDVASSIMQLDKVAVLNSDNFIASDVENDENWVENADADEIWEGWDACFIPETDTQNITVSNNNNILEDIRKKVPEKKLESFKTKPKSSDLGKKEESLGAEFEIKALNEKPVENEECELDFFADMQPKIEKKKKDGESGNNAKTKKPNNIFEMATNQIDVTSWGTEDDLDWKFDED